MKRMGKQTHFSIEQKDKQFCEKQTDKDRLLLYRWIIKKWIKDRMPSKGRGKFFKLNQG